jgi:malic enzyme
LTSRYLFHDDQHGIAVVTLAALFNALRFTKRKPESTSVVVAGAGRQALPAVVSSRY